MGQERLKKLDTQDLGSDMESDLGMDADSDQMVFQNKPDANREFIDIRGDMRNHL